MAVGALVSMTGIQAQVPQHDTIRVVYPGDSAVVEVPGSQDKYIEEKAILTPDDEGRLTSVIRKDSTGMVRKKGRDWTRWRPSPKRALWLALVLPGAGQVYNRKYWKLPIVWGALTACYYAISWNNRQYRDYHEAYRDIMSADPATNTAWLAFAPAGAKAQDYAQYSSLRSTLKRGNDYYRRYRDLSIVATVLVYGLSLLDAYVDAELYTFDISPDLSLRLSPEIAVPALPRPALQLGVNCSLTF